MFRITAEQLLERRHMEEPSDVRLLFHRLNNQLGVVLAHAELLEAKAADETTRARASQVVAGVLDAMSTAKQLRMQFGSENGDSMSPRRS
jgi:hypothetical protein